LKHVGHSSNISRDSGLFKSKRNNIWYFRAFSLSFNSCRSKWQYMCKTTYIYFFLLFLPPFFIFSAFSSFFVFITNQFHFFIFLPSPLQSSFLPLFYIAFLYTLSHHYRFLRLIFLVGLNFLSLYSV